MAMVKSITCNKCDSKERFRTRCISLALDWASESGWIGYFHKVCAFPKVMCPKCSEKETWQDIDRTWLTIDMVYECRWDCCTSGADPQLFAA